VKRNYPLTDCIPASGLEMQMYETIKGYQGRRAPPTLKAENNKTTYLRSEKRVVNQFHFDPRMSSKNN